MLKKSHKVVFSHVLKTYKLGSYSNVARLRKAILDCDIVETRLDGLYFTDPVFAQWFKRKMM